MALADLDRRQFLKLVGLSAASLGVPLPYAGGRARAGSNCPLRVVFWYDQVGLHKRGGYPEAVGTPAWTLENLWSFGAQPEETNWNLGALWEPLSAYKSRMNVVTGLGMESQRSDPTDPRDAHYRGKTQAMTAAYRLSGTAPGGESIDQYIARRLRENGDGTRFNSMQVGIHTEIGERLSPLANQNLDVVPLEFDSAQIFSAFFPEDVLNAPGAEEAARARRRQTSVGNLIRREGDRLIRSLSREQREKVQQHLDGQADFQRRLQISVSGPVPDRSIIDPWAQYDQNDGALVWNLTSELNPQLVAAALHANLVRVATVVASYPVGPQFGYQPGDFGTDDVHDLVHEVSGSRMKITDDGDFVAGVGRIRDMNLLMMRRFAAFLDDLASRTEPDGTTLLDNTLVVFCNEIGDGSHDTWRLPWATIGDAQGYFRTGRCINLPRRTGAGQVIPYEQWGNGEDERSRPHNDFFVSIANALGIETDCFGEPTVCTGPITELRG